MTIAFQLDGQNFVALNGGPIFKFTEAIAIGDPGYGWTFMFVPLISLGDLIFTIIKEYLKLPLEIHLYK